jgi:hypothetical protein
MCLTYSPNDNFDDNLDEIIELDLAHPDFYISSDKTEYIRGYCDNHIYTTEYGKNYCDNLKNKNIEPTGSLNLGKLLILLNTTLSYPLIFYKTNYFTHIYSIESFNLHYI